jgi:phosphotransferase system HPr (HPr) family protein
MNIPNVPTLHHTLQITNPHGLHMRPSAAFVETAGKFQSDVTVTHEGRTVNGKSLWDLLLLAAMPGSELTLNVSGPDAAEALEALVRVLAIIPEDVQEQA